MHTITIVSYDEAIELYGLVLCTYNFPNSIIKIELINIRECLTPYRAVKYDCVKLKGFFSYS